MRGICISDDINNGCTKGEYRDGSVCVKECPSDKYPSQWDLNCYAC